MTPPPGSSSTTLALLLFSTSLHFDSSATYEETIDIEIEFGLP
ncbi:hypothetical protein V6Z11_D04G194200 [Gossypium hirsutum]